ncbi:hypothetical protein BC941DRAFT_421408 [Chlamydoabsidia padenii]|nr:hypothetical protein BC941DRAFT_421408 [Chlamydoabsidia padenii]
MSSCHLLPQAKVSLQHILDYINNDNKRPIVVGLSGLSGMGKTTLSRTLEYVLKEEHNLQTTTLSMDDTVTGYSWGYLSVTLNKLIDSNEHSVIIVEGGLLGYKSLPSSHRIWSQLLEHQPTNNSTCESLRLFNETLASLETNVYPYIDLFIQLTTNHLDEWRSHLGDRFSVHQLYLERLNNYGFFDESSSSLATRHLALYLDHDRKMVQQKRIKDGLAPPQEQEQQQGTSYSGQRITTATSGTSSSIRKTWLLSPLMRQQRKYIISTLNPRVLISFAMMSLLGLLGYSRRLSFIIDLFNKIHHFVL